MSGQWVCDRDLWRTEHGKIVEAGDPRARVLIHAQGDILPNMPIIEPSLDVKARHPGEDKAKRLDQDKAEIASLKNSARNDKTPDQDKAGLLRASSPRNDIKEEGN